jgi:hypothetical protein
MKYIYLDWNVFQYMKQETVLEEKSINGLEFKELVKKISNKYTFPYSEGHLKDLSISQEKYITEDLEFIKTISKNNILGFIDNEKIVIQKDYIDIKTFFNQLKESAKDELEQEISLDVTSNTNYEIAVNEMDENNLLKPFIEQNNGILDDKVFSNFIMMMYQNIDNPDFYKKFRVQVHQLKKNFESTTNTLIDKDSNYYSELIAFLNFMIENDINNMKENFHKTMISFLNIDKKRIFEDLTIGAKIELAYSLLDYNQHFRDKINKKNRPTNIFRDIKHLHFASDAKYYITEDNTTYKKSKFVSEVLGLNVKVLKMNELVSKFR